jgi:hypothetical protein
MPSKREGLLRDARVFAEALFATESGPPPADRLDWAMRELDDYLEHGGPRVELIVRGGLALATWAAPPLVMKAPPLARLSLEERQVALDRLEHTPAGLPLFALKATLCFVWYEHPDVLRELTITDDDTALIQLSTSAEGAR